MCGLLHANQEEVNCCPYCYLPEAYSLGFEEVEEVEDSQRFDDEEEDLKDEEVEDTGSKKL